MTPPPRSSALHRWLVAAILIAGTSFNRLHAAEPPSPWANLSLDAPPATERVDDRQVEGVRAVYFTSEPYQGKPTKVFAYYGLPAGATADAPVPGVVCVHGGWGTAYPEWVRLWNSHGFAAIAIDTDGNVPAPIEQGDPARQRHPWSGPPPNGFDRAADPPADQWPYHAVAAIIHANSLLRSFPEVNAKNVGVTGISWGGYLASIVAGVDPRFKFTIPVYGCGFVHQGTSWNKQVDDYGRDRWVGLWDPSSHLPRAKMPMLWVSGTNDGHYHLPLLQKSYRLPPGDRTLAIRVRMDHSHPAGWAPPEIYAFAKAAVGMAPPLVEVKRSQVAAGRTAVQYEAPPEVEVRSAQLNCTLDNGPWIDRVWQTSEAKIDRAKHRLTADLPPGATAHYFNLTDSRGLLSSSEHVTP